MEILRFCLEFPAAEKPNSPLLRRDSNMVSLMPPAIPQNRDFHKAVFVLQQCDN